MTGLRSYLTDYEEINGGFIAFIGNSKGGKITGKGKIRTSKLDFEDVYFVKGTKVLTSSGVSQMCARKKSVLFTNMNNVVPQGGLTCLFAKATLDESNLWHKRLDGIENLIDLKVKVIRCDNGTEFKNRVMNQFYEMKGIKRVFSVARTSQQNGVVERKNRTLIEATMTMLADSKLPTTFWAEAVNTACYVQNRVLVIKPHNKTPYELFLGRKPSLSFMRPFGCLVTILSTIDHLGKFDGKDDEGFFVGYSTNSKAFRVFNSRTRIVEKNLHVQFSENKPNIAGSEPNWLFDIDTLTNSMNYKPVVVGNQSNGNAGIKACNDADKARMETISSKDYILLPVWPADLLFSQHSKSSLDDGFKQFGKDEKRMLKIQGIRIVRFQVHRSLDFIKRRMQISKALTMLMLPNLEEIIYSDDDEDVGTEADMTNLDTHILVWTLVDLPDGKRAIGTKWVYRNKKDERVTRIEAIRLFLAYASYKDFVVYQMDVKSAFLYGKIEEGVYVCQPPSFEDLDFPDRVYKVEKALYGLHQAPRAWYETLSTYLLDNGFQRGQIDKTLFIKRVKGDILLVEVYVDDIIFGSIKKIKSTPMETLKPLMKDESDEDVDVHLYRSMIASLMYLTSSRPDIIQPKLGLWYPKDSPFDLEAYTDSDNAGASLDRKSTT
ncbi:putative ribonuclease H-like domain-containing protein [Tanacetum coccineum]